MKKRTLWIGLLALLLLLTGCGGGAEPHVFAASDIQALVDGGAFSEELEALDGEVAYALYRLSDAGLSQESLQECTVVRSAGATCEEGAVLLFDTEDNAKTALTALQSYLDGQIASNRDYRPDELPKLESALLQRSGTSVLLVVASDGEAAKTALNLS